MGQLTMEQLQMLHCTFRFTTAQIVINRELKHENRGPIFNKFKGLDLC